MYKENAIKKRKGQFFVIGAVIIVVFIYSIQDILNETWMIDSSDLQKDNTVWILNNIEKNVLETLENSNSTTEIENNIKELMAMEQETVISHINLEHTYYQTGRYIEITYQISKENMKLTKNTSTNIDCLHADPNQQKCNLLDPTLKIHCCSAFNLCC